MIAQFRTRRYAAPQRALAQFHEVHTNWTLLTIYLDTLSAPRQASLSAFCAVPHFSHRFRLIQTPTFRIHVRNQTPIQSFCPFEFPSETTVRTPLPSSESPSIAVRFDPSQNFPYLRGRTELLGNDGISPLAEHVAPIGSFAQGLVVH